MSEREKDQSRKKDEVRVNEEKWSKALMDSGYTVIPSVILERQKALGLEPLDINIIMYLTTYWWTKDSLPHPSKATIAEAVGVTARTVQRRIAAMEKAGFIERIERREASKGSKTNQYRFDGLIKEAMPYAREKIAIREEREAERKAAARRKKALVSRQGEDGEDG